MLPGQINHEAGLPCAQEASVSAVEVDVTQPQHEPQWQGSPWEQEEERQRFERVWAMAIEAGVYENENRDTAFEYVEEGRFTQLHYINLCAGKLLAEKGIKVELATTVSE